MEKREQYESGANYQAPVLVQNSNRRRTEGYGYNIEPAIAIQ